MMTDKRDIVELLAFYVNGSLSADERQRVEQTLREDTSLQGEVVFLEKLRGEMKEMAFENSPGELGLKRLQKSLQDEIISNDPIARAKSKVAKEQNLGFWRMAAIAACLMLVVQTAMVFLADKTDLTAAGGEQEAAIAATFKPQTTEAEVRNLLISLDVEIVSGPSALGVYQLSGGEDAERTVRELLSHGDIVDSAQRNSK